MKTSLPLKKCPRCSHEFTDTNSVDLEIEVICLNCGFWCRLEEHYYKLESLNIYKKDRN